MWGDLDKADDGVWGSAGGLSDVGVFKGSII